MYENVGLRGGLGSPVMHKLLFRKTEYYSNFDRKYVSTHGKYSLMMHVEYMFYAYVL